MSGVGQYPGPTACHPADRSTQIVASNGPVTVRHPLFARTILFKPSRHACLISFSSLASFRASSHKSAHMRICSFTILTAGSACSSRRHLRVVVAHGCVPALRRHFNADLRMCCTWPGVAPMIAASYSCCGLTPVTNNEDAIELVLLRNPTLLARASRLRKRLFKDLTVRVPPPLVDTPRSSAMMAVFSGVLLSLTCFATALATSGRFEITTVWI